MNKDNLVMWLHEEYFSCLSVYSETGYPVSRNQNCVTFILMRNNNPRHGGLKQHTFTISPFLWVRSLGIPKLNPLLRVLPGYSQEQVPARPCRHVET